MSLTLSVRQVELLSKGLTLAEVLKLTVPEPSESVQEPHEELDAPFEYVTEYKFEDDSEMHFQKFTRAVRETALTKRELAEMIKGCIRFIANICSYLVKEVDPGYGIIAYTVVGQTELRNRFHFDIRLKLTDEEFKTINEKKREDRKKLLESPIYSANLSNLFFKDPYIISMMETTDSTDIVCSSTESFSLRRPAAIGMFLSHSIKYKEDIVTDFIDFTATRIKNPEAWYDQINTIKYQMQNPTKKACRFYINYDPYGQAGKTYSVTGISKMFYQFGITGVAPSSMKDRFNSWISGRLYVFFEEAQNDNYNDKEVEAFIKIWTSVQTSLRGMYKETRSGNNYAIGGLNTNDAGLFGLARSGDAEKRRMVVALFKKNSLTVAEWDAKKALINDPSFAYSLHRYIQDKWVLPSNYSPDGFNSTYDVWPELQAQKKNPVETFDELLKFCKDASIDLGNSTKVCYRIVRKYEARSKFYYIKREMALDNFARHCRLCNNNKVMNGETFKAEFTKLGWTYDGNKKMNKKNCAIFYRTDFDEEIETDEDHEEDSIE